MILENRSNAHKAYIIAQFQAILPGFNSYRVKFGRGQNYAVTVFVDMRRYISHNGRDFHYLRHIQKYPDVPSHHIEVEVFRP